MSDEALSARLQEFVRESPVAREPHIPFLREALQGLRSGARILDVGAGDMPYRELFAGFEYVSNDWAGTEHVPDQPVDIVAPAHALPVEDGSFDAVVCTQVLEHLPEPWEAVAEFHRVLTPGGRLILTAPLTWYLHELPHDYYRFTSYGLGHLIDRAGFSSREIRPMNDSASTLAELLTQLQWILGQAPDGRNEIRSALGEQCAKLAAAVQNVGWLDTQWLLPVSFSAIAYKAGTSD